MRFAGVNYLAVLLATVASFLFGGVWYGMFAKQWMEAAGVKAAGIPKDKGGTGGPSPIPFILAFLAQLVMAWMLAGVIGHLGKVTLWNGLVSGLFIWFGFVMMTLIVNYSFQGAKRALALIDGGHWLGVLVLQGVIIGWMGVR